jgi:(p)ppGpp synthase/HD superfamily hydrolase
MSAESAKREWVRFKQDEILLSKAIKIAHDAHDEQVDKAGKPYIDHPMRVMNAVETIEEKIVGVLHDAVEDSDLTIEDLVKLGFPENLIKAIEAITKHPKEPYQSYLERVMSNPIALRVKIADMLDNMDMSRISAPTEKDWKRYEKYQKALTLLKRDGL